MRNAWAPAAIASTLALAACAHEKTPLQRAAHVERDECAGHGDSSDEMRTLREATVLRVEPITFPVGESTRSEGGSTTAGVRLTLRPPEGVSPPALEHLLRCHNARAIVGLTDEADRRLDPFYAPDASLDIDVKADQGVYVVRLMADKVAANLEILRRANAFADAHRPAPAP